MKWGDNNTIKFLRLYEMHPCLWDNRCPDYKEREVRHEALDKIIAEMNIPHFGHAECRTKIKNIRSQYCQELKKIKLSAKRGGSYTPTLMWFNIIDKFLKNIVVQRTHIAPNEIREPPQPSDIEFIDYMIVKEDSDDDETENESVHEEPSHVAPNQALDVSTSTAHGEYGAGGIEKTEREGLRLLTSAIQKIENAVITNNTTSEFDVFGQSVAAQLKNMAFEDALRLQLEIQHLITMKRINKH